MSSLDSRRGPTGLAAALLYGLLSLAACLALAATLRFANRAMDDLTWSTAVYDRNGTLLRLTLSADQKYRVRATLAELPASLVEAVLLKEDRLYWGHPGVNPAALLRAAWHSYARGDYRAGGSTVTMQLARLLYHLPTDSVRGKLVQILHALALETCYSKTRILETYVSLVPCGGNVEGFPAASLLYFHQPVAGLALPEVLLLCSIPQRPGDRGSGQRDGTAAVVRARDVLFRAWVRRHPGDAGLAVQLALPQELALTAPFHAPHAVTSLLARSTGATRIDTTLDLPLQQTVERILHASTIRTSPFGVRNASALLVDARTMEVRAEVGSADFSDASIDGQVNGTEARRSPGSALKPFLYALAMDQGLIHPLTMLKDAPIHFSGYNPDNFDDDFVGPISAKDALILSRNVPAVALAQQVRNPDLYDFLAAAGVGSLRPRGDYGVSIVLGTAEVTMKELASLYGILANGGVLRPLRDRGDVPAAGTGTALLSPEAAWLTLDILEQKPRPDDLGIGASVPGNGPVAWKTGTSIGFRDAWSVAVFDQYILLVWVGNFDGSGNPAFVGLRAAAPLMFRVIDALRASASRARDTERPRPASIITTEVCALSGKIPNPFCPTVVEAQFIPGRSPIEVCDVHQQVFVDRETGLRRSQPREGQTRTAVYEIWPSDLLALFEKAGLPRRTPPAFAPDESMDAQAATGTAPKIASPLAHGEYSVVAGQEDKDEIPFLAVVPSDATTVYWFLNDSYLGQSSGKTAFFWKARPGTWVVRATDEHGRSGSTTFSVVARQ